VKSQAWYSTPCWIIAGGFIGRSIGEGRVTTAKGACNIHQVECYKLERAVGDKRVRVMCTDIGYMFESV